MTLLRTDPPLSGNNDWLELEEREAKISQLLWKSVENGVYVRRIVTATERKLTDSLCDDRLQLLPPPLRTTIIHFQHFDGKDDDDEDEYINTKFVDTYSTYLLNSVKKLEKAAAMAKKNNRSSNKLRYLLLDEIYNTCEVVYLDLNKAFFVMFHDTFLYVVWYKKFVYMKINLEHFDFQLFNKDIDIGAIVRNINQKGGLLAKKREEEQQQQQLVVYRPNIVHAIIKCPPPAPPISLWWQFFLFFGFFKLTTNVVRVIFKRPPASPLPSSWWWRQTTTTTTTTAAATAAAKTKEEEEEKPPPPPPSQIDESHPPPPSDEKEKEEELRRIISEDWLKERFLSWREVGITRIYVREQINLVYDLWDIYNVVTKKRVEQEKMRTQEKFDSFCTCLRNLPLLTVRHNLTYLFNVIYIDFREKIFIVLDTNIQGRYGNCRFKCYNFEGVLQSEYDVYINQLYTIDALDFLNIF